MRNHRERATAEYQHWLAGFIGEKLLPKELEIAALTACNIFLTREAVRQ